jgi:hypothetical protein
VTDATYESWSWGHRCPGSPEEPKRAMRLARRIARQNFPGVVDLGDIENLVIGVLEVVFDDFDPAKGDQSLDVEVRFLKRFRHLFRQ